MSVEPEEAAYEVFRPTPGCRLSLERVVAPLHGPLPSGEEVQKLERMGVISLIPQQQSYNDYAGQRRDFLAAAAHPAVAGVGPLMMDEDLTPDEHLNTLDESAAWHLSLVSQLTHKVLAVLVRGRHGDDAGAYLSFRRALDLACIAREQVIHLLDYRGSPAVTQMLLARYPNIYFGYGGSVDHFSDLPDSLEGLRQMPAERIVLGTAAESLPVDTVLGNFGIKVSGLRNEDHEAFMRQTAENSRRLYCRRLGPRSSQ